MSVYQLTSINGTQQQALDRSSNAVTSIYKITIEVASRIAETLDMTLGEFSNEVK